jgi:uncharacterized protein (UPF0548 family)
LLENWLVMTDSVRRQCRVLSDIRNNYWKNLNLTQLNKHGEESGNIYKPTRGKLVSFERTALAGERISGCLFSAAKLKIQNKFSD